MADLIKVTGELIHSDRCEVCKHSRLEVAGSNLICRRYPPHPTPLFGQMPEGKPAQVACFSNFPTVLPDWNCGEWASKPGALN